MNSSVENIKHLCYDEFECNYGILTCDLEVNHIDSNHYNYEHDVDWPVKIIEG